jgi:UDP-N-acetylmuramate-alanine ligase
MDILALKKTYLVGIKGSGVSALACILKNLGIKVVGFDNKEKIFTDKILKKERINFYEGFKKENLKKELPVSAIIYQEKKLIDFLQKNLKEKIIITTVGAGDLYKILSRININVDLRGLHAD